MRTLTFGGFLVAVSLVSTGCGCFNCCGYGPGPAALQQQRAVVFDPYPDPNAGPPVVGGRPQGYEQPLVEPARARNIEPAFGGLPRL